MLPRAAHGQAGRQRDQTVVIIWDAATKTQHFIRQASFKSEGDDFGFLIPSPSQPALEESGNEVFPYLLKVTAPPIIQSRAPAGGFGCGCGGKSALRETPKSEVKVLDEKLVAGFNAVVLEASSADALAGWLKDHDYAFSPEVKAWAHPYVEAGWKITALKVAKDQAAADKKSVTASALRLSFKTARPVFPYREPDSGKSAQALDAKRRLLRIYFLAEAKYQGQITKEAPWSGKVAWANKLSPQDRAKTLDLLKMPADTGPANYWLTEFEDNWAYEIAAGDVYFAPAADQNPLARQPITQYVSTSVPNDLMACAIVPLLVMPSLIRRLRRKPPETGIVA